MKVRLLLARYAEVQGGTLLGVGIGWAEIGPDPSPFSIAALVEVPWDETNHRHRLEFIILDADGQPFRVSTPTGDQPFQVAVDFDVGRPPGVSPGRSFTMPVAINIAPLPLLPGREYVVRALINGALHDEATITVRPAAA